ncbi:cell filamentation protein Fic [Canicola haemoglobinophilus]|uniref:Filamentation induced by cAMP protein fic n=1 Tax=Canicola haemoglobinophilus TaxID=733 RepID=A0A1V4B1C5_9PAST|nr:Fic family protein [Canicola haemoglobinophilus]OOS00703.1 cell filamentation protein Fic [Canicola haemoglobinophilus]STO60231.1 filamentation induced by cAMP protein fic [Canicola haemoglobinophilus]
MNTLTQIDHLKQKISQLRPLSASEVQRLREEFIIESSYNSNAIEGNTITLRETVLILKEGMTIAEKPIREHLDIIGFKDAFNYIYELVANNEPLTERAIKDIHSLVLMSNAENRGVYRKIPVRILGAENEPTPPYLIPEEMARLIAKYQQKLTALHPLDAISWLHLAFESIHPFIDGNGGTGRLLLNFELLKQGYLPVDIKFTDRAKYYQCFDEYHKNQQGVSALLALIADYELKELERYLAILENR